ncbi:MAG: hypothetical protein M5R36_05840 [Deltaproteobacteria bacterium]|nr:hypothetical protein [Deltaproteobacteria bacterium]
MDGFLGPEALCDERTLGFAFPTQIAHDRMRRAFRDGLDTAGVPYRWGDSESGLEFLRRHEAVFCPSFEFMEESLQRALAEYLQLGGIVVMGPEVPTRGETMRESAILDDFTARPVHKLDGPVDTLVFNAGAGRLVLLTDIIDPGTDTAQESVAAIVSFLRIAPLFPVTAPCDRSVFRYGDRTLVFLANPTDNDQRPRVTVGGATRLFDWWTGEEFVGTGQVPVAMRPWQVRAMEVAPC